VFASQFATTFDVKLTPLPCLQYLTADQRQAECRRIVGEIQAKAEAENKEKGRVPMGVAAILAQDPHSKPASTDRSPAPFVHASDDSTEIEFRASYRAFVDAFRAGALRLRDRACELVPRPRRNACRWRRDFARWLGARRANTRRIQPTSNDASARKTKPDVSRTARSRH
jgi:hypothetical protein